MGLNPTSTNTTPAEFQERLSSQLLLQPDVEFIFARWAFGAAVAAQMMDEDGFDTAMMELRDGRVTRGGSTVGIAEAMSSGMGGPLLLAMGVVFPDLVTMVKEAKLPGETIKINRPKFIDGATTEANRRLGSTDKIFGTNSQAINREQVDVTVVQYGGPGDANGNIVPLAVTRFAQNRAAHDLIVEVGYQLRRDRWKFVDDIAQSRLLASPNQTTPGGTATASFTAQDAEGMDLDTLMDVVEALKGRKIPGVGGAGKYVGVLDLHQVSQLKKDPKYQNLAKEIDDRNPLNALFPGAVATVENLIVCECTRMPRTTAGAGGALTAYQGLVLAPGALGWASAEGARAIRDKNDDGGRFAQYAWEAYEGWAALDDRFVQKVVTD
jgi:N4-gp56 family major capsid protein